MFLHYEQTGQAGMQNWKAQIIIHTAKQVQVESYTKITKQSWKLTKSAKYIWPKQLYWWVMRKIPWRWVKNTNWHACTYEWTEM